MKQILEKHIEKALVKKVKSLGGLCEKYTSPSRRAVPDRLVSMPGGDIIFVEVKRPGGKVTEAQQRDHDRRRALGFKVMVVDNLKSVEIFPEEG